ncbi:Holliday junction resolvase RuvX [Gemmatimonadota bacterium]
MPRVLGIDHGERRIGLAFGDTDVGVATGLPTITWSGKKDLRGRLISVIDEQEPELLVIGYPLLMDGTRGERCEAVDSFVKLLTGWFRLPVALRDERLTSAEADRIRMEAGRTEKEARAGGLIDRAAAVLLLQNWFDSTDRSGLDPGTIPAGREDDDR